MTVWIGRLVLVAWVLVLVIAAVCAISPRYVVSPTMAYAVVGLSLLLLVWVVTPSLRAGLVSPPFSFVPGLSGAVALTLVALGWVGFRWHFIGTATAAPPAFITDVTARAQFDSVLDYARSLSYDSTTHNAPDSTLIVDSVGGTVYVTRARIAPAVGANFVSYSDLYGTGPGKGRVVARIRLDTTYGRRGYPGLNLPAGVSYVWVDSLELRDTTGTFRAFIIPDTPGDSVVRLPAAHSHYYRSPRAVSSFPMARWILFHSNCTNVPCSRGCCQSCPG